MHSALEKRINPLFTASCNKRLLLKQNDHRTHFDKNKNKACKVAGLCDITKGTYPGLRFWVTCSQKCCKQQNEIRRTGFLGILLAQRLLKQAHNRAKIKEMEDENLPGVCGDECPERRSVRNLKFNACKSQLPSAGSRWKTLGGE